MGLVMMVAVGVRAADAAAASPDPDQRRVPPRAGPPAPEPDFWFGQPRGAVRVHVSRLFAREGSDLFSFLQEQFTIDGHAFDATVVGTEVGVRLTPRASVLFGVDVSRALNPSEYRDFVDSDGIAIVQDTRLTEVNLSTSLKFALTPPGRQISRLAWIPHPITPYVGAGGGALWYRLEQQGEFVDFVDLSIFDARFRSTGWTPSAHVFGGADVNLWKRVFLGLEARYVWADAPLGRDFTGFEPIDLTGLKLTVGATVAF
jgi:hypothetical protein